MCIGIPMQVTEVRPGAALCTAANGRHLIDTSLVGDVEAGTWLMVFLGAAREVISAETACQAADALEALRLALEGESDLDHLFADLAGRVPQLPEHLRGLQPAAEAGAADRSMPPSTPLSPLPSDAGA